MASVFPCGICDKDFDEITKFSAHLESHMNGDLSNEETKSSDEYEENKKKTLGVQKSPGDFNTTGTKATKDFHEKTEQGLVGWACKKSSCHEIFETEHQKMDHWNSVHKGVKCEGCEISYEVQAIWYHYNTCPKFKIRPRYKKYFSAKQSLGNRLSDGFYEKVLDKRGLDSLVPAKKDAANQQKSKIQIGDEKPEVKIQIRQKEPEVRRKVNTENVYDAKLTLDSANLSSHSHPIPSKENAIDFIGKSFTLKKLAILAIQSSQLEMLATSDILEFIDMNFENYRNMDTTAKERWKTTVEIALGDSNYFVGIQKPVESSELLEHHRALSYWKLHPNICPVVLTPKLQLTFKNRVKTAGEINTENLFKTIKAKIPNHKTTPQVKSEVNLENERSFMVKSESFPMDNTSHSIQPMSINQENRNKNLGLVTSPHLGQKQKAMSSIRSVDLRTPGSHHQVYQPVTKKPRVSNVDSWDEWKRVGKLE